MSVAVSVRYFSCVCFRPMLIWTNANKVVRMTMNPLSNVERLPGGSPGKQKDVNNSFGQTNLSLCEKVLI